MFLYTEGDPFDPCPCADSAVPRHDGVKYHCMGGDFCTFEDDTVLYSRTGTNACIGTDGDVGADLGGGMDRRAGMDVYRGNDFRVTRACRRRCLVCLLQI